MSGCMSSVLNFFFIFDRYDVDSKVTFALQSKSQHKSERGILFFLLLFLLELGICLGTLPLRAWSAGTQCKAPF